jgi:winged helix DNA-binding protein
VRTISDEERRARLVRRHHLASPATSVEDAARSVFGLHSSDPVSVYVSAWARMKRFAVADLEQALYERRSLVRMLGMRRTMFVVPVDAAAVMDEACTKTIASRERRRLVRLIEEAGIAPAGRGSRWLARVERATLAALSARGEATARELSAEVPELREKIAFGEGKTWGGTMGMSTRVLFLLAANGAVLRGRPLGTFVSSQYRWALTERWLGEPLPTIGHAEAGAELVRRYLRAFGPVTITDLRWWTGWTARSANSALADAGAVEVALARGTGFVLEDDLRAVRAPAASVALLPGLDPTIMGWKERDWYLGPHAPRLFDRAGNAGPTVWVDGRVVGGWAQAPDGEIRVELLEPVTPTARRAIDAQRERLRSWFGDVRFVTRFRSPIERSLVG